MLVRIDIKLCFITLIFILFVHESIAKLNTLTVNEINIEWYGVNSEDTTINILSKSACLEGCFVANISDTTISYKTLKQLLNLRQEVKQEDYAQIQTLIIFQIKNMLDTEMRALYFCGKHNLIQMYTSSDSTIVTGGMKYFAKKSNPLFPNFYLPFTVEAKSYKEFYVLVTNYGNLPDKIKSEIHICKVHPRLKKLESKRYFGWLVFSTLTCGGILLLAIFVLLQYFSTKRKEFLYYGLYALTMFLNIERASEWNFEIRYISMIYHHYYTHMAVPLNILAGIFYLYFTIYYFELKQQDTLLKKIIYALLALLICGLIILLTTEFLGIKSYFLFISLKSFTFIPLISASIVVALLFIRQNKSIINSYYFIGFAFLIIGATTNILLNNFSNSFAESNNPRVIYLSIGVLLEVLCFALGLGVKLRLFEKSVVEKEIEILKLQKKHLIHISEIRNKLSRDLHDDIGSTISSINILSKTAQHKSENFNAEKITSTLKKINERSQRLLTNMSDIIWNINPNNDSLEDLLSRMREYVTTILEAKEIDYSLNFPNSDLNIKLSMQIKNNLYLVLKESVNNLAKYSNASKANVSLLINENNINLTIEDNGIGFDINNIKHKGGLLNMQQRSDEIQAKFQIHSLHNEGTKIDLTIRI